MHGRSWGRTWISVLGLERSVAGALLLGSRFNDVCIGTNKKNDRAYYLARGRAIGDPHGQAPMLWLAGVPGR